MNLKTALGGLKSDSKRETWTWMSGLCQGPYGKEICFTVGLRKLSSNVGFEQRCNVRSEEPKQFG